MTLAAQLRRTVVKELLTGCIGTTRTVSPELAAYGVFDGQPLQSQQAKTMDRKYAMRFDVRFGALRRHGATPTSIKASHRLALLPVEIPLWVNLLSTVQEAERDEQRAKIESYCDVLIQALSYPGNLAATENGDATDIVSGLLLGPDGNGTPEWEVIEENWDTQLHRSVIRASGIVKIDQAVA